MLLLDTDAISIVQRGSEPQTTPPRLLNPLTKEAFVLLRVDEYKQLTTAMYDDSRWTRDELAAVAWETAERAGWDAEADDLHAFAMM